MTPKVEQHPEPGRCPAVVYRKDTWRILRRGDGFEMHFTKSQCRRKTQDGALCWQHREEVGPVSFELVNGHMVCTAKEES